MSNFIYFVKFTAVARNVSRQFPIRFRRIRQRVVDRDDTLRNFHLSLENVRLNIRESVDLRADRALSLMFLGVKVFSMWRRSHAKCLPRTYVIGIPCTVRTRC